jgi:hypothetical protein
MEIHAPERPIESVRDFAMHIAVVTCGILIALGLEGVREAIHNHRLVRETRQAVREEMAINVEHMHDELPRVTLYRDQLKSLLADLPALERDHPEQVSVRLAAVQNPGYFFLANSWQAALSTGALEHMSAEEVETYGGAAQVIKIYTDIQGHAGTQEGACKAFFQAHPHLTPEQAEEGTERLLLFYRAESSLAFVGPQMQRQVEQAIRAAR